MFSSPIASNPFQCTGASSNTDWAHYMSMPMYAVVAKASQSKGQTGNNGVLNELEGRA